MYRYTCIHVYLCALSVEELWQDCVYIQVYIVYLRMMREGLHVHMYITLFGSAVITMATNGIHQEEENVPNTRGQCKHMYMYM